MRQQLVAQVCTMRARIGERLLAPLTAAEAARFLQLIAKLVGMDEVKRRLDDGG